MNLVGPFSLEYKDLSFVKNPNTSFGRKQVTDKLLADIDEPDMAFEQARVREEQLNKKRKALHHDAGKVQTGD